MTQTEGRDTADTRFEELYDPLSLGDTMPKDAVTRAYANWGWNARTEDILEMLEDNMPEIIESYMFGIQCGEGAQGGYKQVLTTIRELVRESCLQAISRIAK